jgi:predicted Zn-dependent protease with MMP-like domain/Tfp pilus assembly protein PilF
MTARIERELEAAWADLEEGDLDAAQRRLSRLEERSPRSADVCMLAGEVASMSGEPERAVEHFLRAAQLRPGWPDPILSAADESLESLGDPDRALELVEPLLDDEGTPEDVRVDALLLAAAALVDGGDAEAAIERLEEVEELDPDDPEQLHSLADLWLELDPARAEAVYRDLADRDPEDLDALWGLGFALRERGVSPAEPWLELRARELAGPAPELELDAEELETIAEETLRELPEWVRARLRDVPILIEDVPSEALVREGVDPRLLGLFTGTPMPEKSSLDGASTAPDAAYLFLRNLARACESEEELAEQVRITILHETAHFFGLEDEDLEAIGLG